MDTGLLILLIVVFFILGWLLSARITAEAFYSALRDLGITEQQLRSLHSRYARTESDKHHCLNIAIEQVDGVYLAFAEKTNSFIAQGKDSSELLAKIIDRVPAGTRIHCEKSQGAEILAGALENLKSKT